MRRIVATMMAALAMIGSGLVMAAPAEAGISQREFARVHKGMKRPQVTQILHRRGHVVGRIGVSVQTGVIVRYRARPRVRYFVVFEGGPARRTWRVTGKGGISRVPGADGCWASNRRARTFIC